MIKLGGLDLLSITESEKRLSQLPSWVPNWNSRSPTNLLAGHFHAGFHQKDKKLFDDVLLPDSNRIQLRGFKLGTIIGMSALSYKKYKDWKELIGPEGLAAQFLNMIDEAYKLCRRVCRQPENVLLKRFARTLVADTVSKVGTSHVNNHKYLQNVLEDYVWYRAYLSDCKHFRRGEDATIDKHHLKNNAEPYSLNHHIQWQHRSFFVTDSGHMGLCSQSCRLGDVVCIFLSAKDTHVLRQVPEESCFTLVSSAYTDGVMYGEALDGRDRAQDEIFIID